MPTHETTVDESAPIIRTALAEDALVLARLFDMADGGQSVPRWAAIAEAGQSPFAVGAAEILSNQTRQSLRNARVAMSGRTVIGALLCYRMTAKMRGAEDTPYARLKAHVPGSWYIDSLAVAEGWRRYGVGGALLDAAAIAGRSAGCTALSLLVHDTNAAAIALYVRHGFAPTQAEALPRDHPTGARSLLLFERSSQIP